VKTINVINWFVKQAAVTEIEIDKLKIENFGFHNGV